MNKKILAAAIAASIAAPMAVAADVTVYGRVQQSIVMSEVDNSGNAVTGTDDITDVASKGTKLGFKGSEDLGNGMKANFQLELNADGQMNNTGTSFASGRNSYVGLSGDFGEFRIGSHDTPAKIAATGLSTFGDQLGDVNEVANMNNTHSADAYAYISPNFSGFHVAAAAITGSQSWDNQFAHIADKVALGNAGQKTSNADTLAAGYSLAAFYDNAGLSLRAYYENVDDLVETTTTVNGADNWGLGARYKMDNMYVSAGYEEFSIDLTGVQDIDVESWYIEGGYTMGNTTLKGIYGDVDVSDKGNVAGLDGDNATWAIGLDHKLSKRTMVWVQYADSESGTNDGTMSTINTGRGGADEMATESAWEVGVRHDF